MTQGTRFKAQGTKGHCVRCGFTAFTKGYGSQGAKEEAAMRKA